MNLFRRGLRTPLLEGILMVTSWRFGVEVRFEPLRDWVTEGRQEALSAGGDHPCPGDTDLGEIPALVDGVEAAEEFGLPSEFGETLRSHHLVSFLFTQCELRADAADAFYEVWQCIAIEYRVVLCMALCTFIRAVADLTLTQSHVGVTPMDVTSSLLDAWEASMHAMVTANLHPALFLHERHPLDFGRFA
jgi:hypothetical protein